MVGGLKVNNKCVGRRDQYAAQPKLFSLSKDFDPFASAIGLAPSRSLRGLASITQDVGGTSGLRGKQ